MAQTRYKLTYKKS